VCIQVTVDDVLMRVTDDGRGLPEHLIEGVGLAAIRERAADLGGTVELSSGSGTTVTTVVPLRPSGSS
jgi:signal transduction histidine kinase